MENTLMETKYTYESSNVPSQEAIGLLQEAHETIKIIDILRGYLWKRGTELFTADTCLLDGDDHLDDKGWHDEDLYFFLVL